MWDGGTALAASADTGVLLDLIMIPKVGTMSIFSPIVMKRISSTTGMVINRMSKRANII